MSGNSWVTLATNDSYSLGALVLARSLKRVGTIHNLTVLVTPGVSTAMRNQLASIFNVIEEVNILDSKDEKNLALLTRPDLGITFTKLHCWRLTQFSKCVFLDADVLVLQNCDELFDREELSAAPDVGWPDCFNSGVFVYRPSIETYNALINFALSQGSFDGGDQGLLNQFFADWATKDISRHLPFIYNMCSSATYSYLPAFKQFGQNVKIVHFIGASKPWLQYLESETRQVRPTSGSEHLQGLLQLWWDIFCNDVHSTLSSEMVHCSSQVSQLENSPMSHFIREICLNLEPKTSFNQCEPPTLIYEHDPSDGYWDPWETYQEPEMLQTIRSGKQFISSENDHEGNGFQGNTNIQYYNAHYQNTTSVEQHFQHSYHEQQCSQIEQQNNLSHQAASSSHVSEHHESHVHADYHRPQEHRVSDNNYAHNVNDYRQEQPLHSNYQAADFKLQESKGDENTHTCSYERSTDVHRSHHVEHEHGHNQTRENHIHKEVLPPEERYKNEPGLNIVMNAFNEHVSAVSHPASLPLRKTSLSPDIVSTYDTECLSSPATTELENEDAGLAGALSQLTLGVARSPEQIALEEHLRKQAWEHGNIDYMGRDSFDNIWQKICQTLAEAPSADPLPEQRESSSQVSSVVVETISKEVTSADVTPPTLPETHSVASAPKESIDATLSSTDTGPISKTLDVSSDSALSDTKPVSVLNNISSTSPEVLADLPSPSPATNVSDLVSSAPALSSPELQDSSVDHKLVSQLKDTVSSSAVEISTDTVQPVIPQDVVIVQKDELQLAATDRDTNLGDSGKEHESQERHVSVPVSLPEVPLPDDPLQELLKSPSESVVETGSDAARSSISPKDTNEASGENEPELKTVPLTGEAITVASVDSQLTSAMSESQAESETQSAKLVANVDTSPTESSAKDDTVSAETKSSIDLVSQSIISSTQSTVAPTSDGSADAQKVIVTAPTPPTSPTDSSIVPPSAPVPVAVTTTAAAAEDSLSVDPSILPTPPVISDLPSAEAAPSSGHVSDTPDDSQHPSAKPAPSSGPVSAPPPDDSQLPSAEAAPVSDTVPESPASVPLTSESPSSPESSQAVDPKAPIPPKRRHKPSDQSGNKGGKAPTKSPKGKK